MVKRDQLTQFIYQTIGQDLLDAAVKNDDNANSLQIRGREKVERVALGVSLSFEFLEQAIQQKADYCILHHGIRINDTILRGRFEPYEDRLKLIFQNELTITGFHYTLDVHPTIGNNAIIISRLGAKRTNEPFFDGWGWVGEYQKPIDVKSIAARASALFKRQVYTAFTGPKQVKRIGVCSGGAKPRGNTFYEIIDKKIDLLISGEISESGPYYSKEGRYNYFSCGHYATETFGISALGDKIKDNFGQKINVMFIDTPTIL